MVSISPLTFALILHVSIHHFRQPHNHTYPTQTHTLLTFAFVLHVSIHHLRHPHNHTYPTQTHTAHLRPHSPCLHPSFQTTTQSHISYTDTHCSPSPSFS